MKKNVLGRDAFLSNAKLKIEPVELDNGIVYVKELTGRGLLEYNDKIEELKKLNPELTTASSLQLAALLVAKTVCDGEGNLLFTEADVDALMNNSLGIIKLLAEKAMQVCGISQEAIEEVSANLKKAEKDSSTTD